MVMNVSAGVQSFSALVSETGFSVWIVIQLIEKICLVD